MIMIHITDKQIDKAIAKIDKMDEAQFGKFFDSFSKSQPELFDYILHYSDALHNDEARDEFIFIMSVIWECYRSLKLKLAEVTVKEINSMEKTQMKEWEKLNTLKAGKEEDAFIKKFITQPALWAFMTETAFEDPEKPQNSNFSHDDDIAILYSSTKMMCGLLDKQVAKASEKAE